MNKRVAIWIALGVLGFIAVTAIGIFAADPGRRLGASNDRSYAAGNTLIQIDGVSAGFVKTLTGCETLGDVVKEQPGTDGVIRKHISQPRHDPCVIEVTAAMGEPVFNWIRATLNRNPLQKTVTLIVADYQYKEKSRLTLQGTTLAKVAFPALSGGDKSPATIKLSLQPEAIQRSTGNAGTTIQGTFNTKQKTWVASNFRVTMSGGLPATKVASVSSFEVTQELPQDSIGVVRDPLKEAGKLELGNLAVAVGGNEPVAWDAWFHSFVIQGNNGQSDEKTATIEFLEPNMQDVLFTLTLEGVGIFRAGALTAASTEKASSSSYSLYAEQAAFSSTLFGSAAVGGTGGTGGAGGTTTTTTTTTPTKATTISEATIIAVAASRLADGETFTISDGTNEPTTFEFDLDGESKAIPVKLAKDASVEEVAGAIAEAINGISGKLELTAKTTGEAQIELLSTRADAEGEEKILEFVEDESFKVQDKVVERSAEDLPAPAELTAATGGEGEVTVSWQPSEGALGYLILFSTEPGGEYRELDKSEETKLNLAGLDSGVTHYFVVRALDGIRESANSNEASASAG